jgi:inhibitor of cysteine peptidase
MKTKLLAMGAMAALSLLLFGCSGTPKEAVVEVSCDDFSGNQHITREVQVPVNGTIELSLCSNPTTGFEWEAAKISNKRVLKEADHKFIEPESEGVVGAAGKDVWTFQALERGTATVTVAYSRPWEGGEKGEWTFELNVTVK